MYLFTTKKTQNDAEWIVLHVCSWVDHATEAVRTSFNTVLSPRYFHTSPEWAQILTYSTKINLFFQNGVT